jgi:hypothetical protein
VIYGLGLIFYKNHIVAKLFVKREKEKQKTEKEKKKREELTYALTGLSSTVRPSPPQAIPHLALFTSRPAVERSVCALAPEPPPSLAARQRVARSPWIKSTPADTSEPSLASLSPRPHLSFLSSAQPWRRYGRARDHRPVSVKPACPRRPPRHPLHLQWSTLAEERREDANGLVFNLLHRWPPSSDSVAPSLIA